MGDREPAGDRRLGPTAAAARSPRRRRVRRCSMSRSGGPGSPGASVLGRVGRRMGLTTVRDLLFHLPRRYDDLREMRKLGDLGFVEDGTVVSARVTRGRRPGRGVVPAPHPAHDRRARGRDRLDRGDVVRAALHRAPAASRRAGDRVGEAEALRAQADARQPGLPAGGARRRAPPRRPDRADLPADGRAHRADAAARRPRRARSSRARPTPSTCRRRCAAREGLVGIGDALEEAHYPATFGRAGRRRSGASRSTSCSRSRSGMVGRRRERGLEAARADRGRRRGRRRDSPLDHRVAVDEAGAGRGAHGRPGHGHRAIRADLARPTPDAPAAAGRRRVGQDRGGGVGARGDGARRPPGGAPRPDGPPGAPAPADARGSAGGAGTCRRAPHRLAARRGREGGRGPPGLRDGADRRRDARPDLRSACASPTSGSP